MDKNFLQNEDGELLELNNVSLDALKSVSKVGFKKLDVELPASAKRIAVDILRKKRGYKTILVKDVTKVVRRRVDNALIAYDKGSTAFLTK